MIGDRAVVFAENMIRWKRSFALRELGIWVVALQGVERITLLIKSVSGIFLLVDVHLQEPSCRAKEFDVKAVSDGIIESFSQWNRCFQRTACHQQRMGGVAIDCVCHGGQNMMDLLGL
jgi:hypothetical protein